MRQTAISGNVVLLCRYLRRQGYVLGPTEEADALQALTYQSIESAANFKSTLKAILAKNKWQQDQFDAHYLDFWEQLAKAVDSKIKKIPEKSKHVTENQKKQAQFESLKDWLNLNPTDDEVATAAYSNIEVLVKKNFSSMDEDEMRLIFRLLQKMARKMAHRKSRLRKRSKKKTTPDLKRTIRANLRRGGEITEFIYSKKKDRKLKLVLLCDVSKSMDLYSRFFIHLIYAFQNAYDKIETFVFSTALHRVSDLLDNNEYDRALEQIAERVPNWSGGTTIGACLQDFVTEHAHHLLNKKTIVLILSDGWDTGAPEIMKVAMKTIFKKSQKVIWLNPLGGNPHYAPEVSGLKVALPYIDVLAAAHNLESLQAVVRQLQKKRARI